MSLFLVLPIMVSTLISKLLADYLHKGGIYDCLIQMNGYPFMDNRDDAFCPENEGISMAADVMTNACNLHVISENEHNLSAICKLCVKRTFADVLLLSTLFSVSR